jgi:hypothetical protein
MVKNSDNMHRIRFSHHSDVIVEFIHIAEEFHIKFTGPGVESSFRRRDSCVWCIKTMLYDLIFLMHVDHWHDIIPVTFHLVCMEACHLLAYRMLAIGTSVFARFFVLILFRIDLVSGIFVSSCKLGIVDVPHTVVLVFLLKTEFGVFFNMLVVLLWLVSNDIVVVALFHENVFLV